MALFSYQPRVADDLFDVFDELALSPYEFRAPARDPRRNLLNLASLERDCEVQNTDKEFRVTINLQHYSPEEVKITSDDERIIINAKHEEKQDRHGIVSREITRVFSLPENTDPKSITSTMNQNGRLSIRVQKLAIEPPKEITIPVEYKPKE